MFASSQRVTIARRHENTATVAPMPRSTIAPPAQFREWVIGKAAEQGLTTMAAIARAVGTDPSTVSRWLGGQNGVSVDSLRRLAPALNVRIGDILVAAGLSPGEIGLVPQAPLPTEIREQVRILDGDDFTVREKRAFLRSIARNTETFLEVVEEIRNAPREPQMRRRA